MEEAPQYTLNDTGEYIDAAIDRALHPDNHPTDGSTRFVTSAGIKEEFDKTNANVEQLKMKADRDIDITQAEWDKLVADGAVDPGKNYYIQES